MNSRVEQWCNLVFMYFSDSVPFFLYGTLSETLTVCAITCASWSIRCPSLVSQEKSVAANKVTPVSLGRPHTYINDINNTRNPKFHCRKQHSVEMYTVDWCCILKWCNMNNKICAFYFKTNTNNSVSFLFLFFPHCCNSHHHKLLDMTKFQFHIGDPLSVSKSSEYFVIVVTLASVCLEHCVFLLSEILFIHCLYLFHCP